MRKNTGFTLVEVLVAVALTGVILLTGYSAFQKIMQSQSRLGAAIDVQKNLFYTNEKMAALIRDGGTIDYEEYFNRRMLGYDRSKVDTNGDPGDDVFLYTFSESSHFGNGNVANKPPIYYCGFQSSQSTADMCLSQDLPGYVNLNKDADPFSTGITIYPINTHQAYGQYAALALNYDDLVGFPMPIKLPPIFEADKKIMVASRAIDGTASLENKNTTEVGLPELYLIKKNINNSYIRTYFRHVYVQDPFTIGTIPCNPTNPNYSLDGCLGKIQMTKLSGCEVGTADGVVDAWIPTQDFWTGAGAWNCTTLVPDEASIYKSALETALPGPNPAAAPANLKWVDVTAPEMNVIRATFLPNPLKIPALMSGAGDPAQSPSVSVYLEVQLSTKLRNKSFVRTNMNYPRTLITTYDLSE